MFLSSDVGYETQKKDDEFKSNNNLSIDHTYDLNAFEDYKSNIVIVI